MDLDYYKNINNFSKTTNRKENYLYDWYNLYERSFEDSVDFQKGKINQEDADMLVIDKNNSNTVKYIKTRVDKKILVGDLVDVLGHTFLVTEVDANTEKINQGKMEQCNWVLKWIDENKYGRKVIKSCHCVLGNATQYNSGEYEGKYLTIGTSQFVVMLPSNEDTIELRKGHRFLIGKGKEPIAYKITSIDHATFNYTEKGIIRLMIAEDVLKLKEDNLKLLIADYWKDRDANISNIDDIKVPKPPQISGITGKIIKDDTTVRVGDSIKLSAVFTDNNNGDVLDVDNFEWKVSTSGLGDKNIKITKGSVLTIEILDGFDIELLPYFITVSLMYNNELHEKVTIKVRGLFG